MGVLIFPAAQLRKIDISFSGGKPSIKFNYNDYINNDGNLNMVLYDKRLLNVVDSKSYNI